MTLVEVIIATSLLGIVSLGVHDRPGERAERRRRAGRAHGAQRPVEAGLGRPGLAGAIGNLLYNPSSETGNIDPFGVAASGYMFRVYTQVKFAGTDDPRCSLWAIDDEERLLYRWWPVLDPDAATDWRVVADGVVNRSVGTPRSSSMPPDEP